MVVSFKLLSLFCLLRPVYGQNELNAFDHAKCRDLKESGVECPEASPQYRWYYNDEKFVCLQFKYNGCNGNGNNFANQAECEQCMRIVADRFRCWGNGGHGEFNDRCGHTFNCTKPYVCVHGEGAPVCCNENDSVCPDGSPPYSVENDTVFGDSCEDLSCPSDHRCDRGIFVARCCHIILNEIFP